MLHLSRAPAGGRCEANEALLSQHRSTRWGSLDASIRCTFSSRVRSHDASLQTFAARGSAVVVQRVCRLHGRISGSGYRRVAQTPGEPVLHTPLGSRGSRNRIVRRCIAASGSVDSCRAGRSSAPRAALSPPPRQHWTAPRRRGIKACKAASQGAEHRGPGVRRQSNCPGLRLTVLYPSRA